MNIKNCLFNAVYSFGLRISSNFGQLRLYDFGTSASSFGNVRIFEGFAFALHVEIKKLGKSADYNWNQNIVVIL